MKNFISHIFIFSVGILLAIVFFAFSPKNSIDVANIIITFVFFAIVSYIFTRSYLLLDEGLNLKEDLDQAEKKIIKLKDNNHGSLFDSILNEERFFYNDILNDAFTKYKNDISIMQKEALEAEIDIERYINYELIETSINTHFLNLISGTMTGLGILGTFLGLSVGLNSFNLRGSAEDITREIQPLMSGIKVAFHTSIYGLVYSILFNFYYRDRLKEFSEAISSFINTWQKYVVPVSKNGNETSLIKYQNLINDSLNRQIKSNSDFYSNTENNLKGYHKENIEKYDKQIEQQAEIISLQEHQRKAMDAMSEQMAEQVSKMMKETIIPEIIKMREAVVKFAEAAQEDQIKAMQKVVEVFLNGMEKNMGQTFQNLRETLNETNEWQKKNIKFTQDMMESMGNTAVGMDNINKHIDSAVANVAKYAEAVEQMQNSVNVNLMSLNVQAESSRELIESQKELIDKIIETENSAKNNFIAIIEKIDKQTESLNDFNSKIEQKIKDEFSAFANNIDNITNGIKTTNNQVLDEITKTNKEYVEELNRITTTNQTIINKSYDEFTNSLNETNKQSIEKLTNTSNECINKISGSSFETQKMLSNGFTQIATSITNTTSSLHDKLIAVSTKMDNQLETLTDMNNNLKQELQNEVEVFATELNTLTSTIVIDCKKALETLSQSSINYVEKLENITTETQTQLQEKFNNMESIIRTKLEKVGEINGRLVDDISNAATNLGNAAKSLDNGLSDRITETFKTFDIELAEVVKHFSGTIKHMDDAVGNTKYTFDLLSKDIDDKFEKMQEHLDQYLEYADKLHHNLEYKWNQLKNEVK